LDEVQLCRPRHGSMYPRTQDEAFALRTDDITTEEKVGCKEYPRELIKTRLANRTDDILGAQANTWCAYPRLWKVKDPSASTEKETNRVKDIDGAVAGTGGQGPLLYRVRVQAAMMTPGSATLAPAAAASRKADIQAVKDLP